MKRVLWVEDDPAMLGGVERILRRQGLEVETAMDVETALNRLHTDRFDIAIIDLILPASDLQSDFGGLKVAEAIRDREQDEPREPTTTIVFLSAFVGNEVQSQLKRLNASLISKVDAPHDFSKMLARITGQESDDPQRSRK